MDAIADLLRDQHGVISRRQLLACGLTGSDIKRLVRRRELRRVHRGVYVDHTGPPTWVQRAWAAVLFSWPAALSHESALRLVEGPGRRDRNLNEPDGVRIHRTAHLGARALWNVGPPRIRYEHALLDVTADTSSDLDAIAVLADACGSRRSTATRILRALDERQREARRPWLVDVLTDIAAGTCSVLEHGYLTRVERAHGLPTGRRQASHRHAGHQVYRDVSYDEQTTIVELDGRLLHSSVRQRDRDLDRDLDAAAVSATETVRLSWGQVFDRPCRTARALEQVLQRRTRFAGSGSQAEAIRRESSGPPCAGCGGVDGRSGVARLRCSTTGAERQCSPSTGAESPFCGSISSVSSPARMPISRKVPRTTTITPRTTSSILPRPENGVS